MLIIFLRLLNIELNFLLYASIFRSYALFEDVFLFTAMDLRRMLPYP